MSRFRFSSKLSTDGFNTGTVDPDNTKKSINDNNPNHKSERYITQTERLVDHVDVPVSVNEYKFTVQTKVEAGHPAHAQTQFSHAKQRLTSLPISQPMEKHILATNNDMKPLNPVPFNKHPVKEEHAKDYGIISNTEDRPISVVLNEKSQIHDKKFSSPRKSYRVIDEKGDKPSTLVRNLGYKPPIVKGEETKNNRSLEKEWEKTRSLVHKQPPDKVEEFITKETKIGLLKEENWHNISCANVYGDYNFRKKDLDKPGADTARYEQVLEPFESWKKWIVRYKKVSEPFGSWKQWMERD